MRDNIRSKKIRELASVDALKTRSFHFAGLKDASRRGGYIQIRYQVRVENAAPNDVMSYLWVVGDPRKTHNNEPIDRQYVPCKNESVRTMHTIRVPASVVSDDGDLLVTFVNADPYDAKQSWPSDILFAGDGSLEVLYPVGGFEANLFRALLMLLVQMCFLAALGLLAASFLTFPTAVLMCLVVFAASGGVKYLQDAMHWTDQDTSSVISHGVTVVTGPAVKVFLGSIPDLSEYSPSGAIVDGRVVAWSFGISPSLGWALVDVGIRTALILLAGCWILTRREVAQVVV